jgi:hypothetical protein
MSGKQFFEARSETDGVYVDNLKNQPCLPWKIFSEAINCLKENGGQAKKGNATNSRLGDPNLGLDTLEGYIASRVYGCSIGDTVFKRITSSFHLAEPKSVRRDRLCEGSMLKIGSISTSKARKLNNPFICWQPGWVETE